MAVKRKKKPPEEGAPEWMVTYGDLMTLLMTFFVLLFSFSSIQESKFRNAIGSLKGALGVLLRNPKVMSQVKSDDRILPQKERKLMEALKAVRKLSEEERFKGQIKLIKTKKGYLISISNPVMFEIGKAVIKPELYSVLDMIAQVIRAKPMEVRVVGHTCDLPIHTSQFPSNWELSATRAVNVVKHLESKGIPGAKFSAEERSKYSPIAPNDSEENRSLNRRVEIYLDYINPPLEPVRPINPLSAPGKEER